MDAVVLFMIIAALAIGAVIGWLIGSRAAAGAKQTVETLRLQLDEVVRERDVNRDAATRLAALEASQLEREKGLEARINELQLHLQDSWQVTGKLLSTPVSRPARNGPMAGSRFSPRPDRCRA